MAGGPTDRGAVQAALAHVGLAQVQRDRVRVFSAGMRRRLGLARLLLRPVKVLLLDEPYASFDPEGIGVVNELALRVAAGGGVVVLATHDVARAVDVMSRRLHLADGRLTEVHDGGLARVDAALWSAGQGKGM
jgi:ABC-type transport system involved in cytochrome c biogenesis ATPase subunit